VSVRPKAVAALFDLGKEKKKEAVTLVTQYLAKDKTLSVPKHLKTMFLEEKKQDDLSDSLLQGLAYFMWEDNLRAEFEKIAELRTGCECKPKKITKNAEEDE